MKAVVYDKPRSFSIRELPDPMPGPGEVRLRILLAGVCGTDSHLHVGQFGPSYPLTPGHEMVGEVDLVGPGVTELRPGQRVVVDNTRFCNACESCRRGLPTYCTNTVAQGVNAPGGFAELVVAPQSKCFVVDDLTPDVAVFAEPTACVVHGLDVLAAPPVSTVLLFGAGPTGLLLAQLLTRNGVGHLTVAAPTAFKLDMVKARGADEVVQIDRQDPSAATARFRELAPGGFDIVIDATGALKVLEQSIPLTRDGGTVFVYGMTDEADRWAISPYEVFRRELTIKGSFAQRFSFDRALTALRTGRVDTSGMITHRFGLSDYADALEAVADSHCVKAVIEP